MKALFRLAFTLAEVLIVLGIIGIIADMTIPTLKRDIDKIVYVTQLKKFYSTFQQGMQMLMVTEGVSQMDYTSLFNGSASSDANRNTAIDEAIKKTFNTIKTCKHGDSSCNILSYKDLSGIPKTWLVDTFAGTGYIFYTADGMAINLSLSTQCSISNNVGNCGNVLVDVNGVKKPNTLGRDFFYFRVDIDGSLYPVAGAREGQYGGSGSEWRSQSTFCGTPGSTKISGVIGFACAARIMEEGWKMDY